MMLALIGDGHIVSLAGGGRKTVSSAGTAEQLATSGQVSGVVIQALEGNTGYIAVGGSDVVAANGSRKGVVLSAGESITLAIRELANVWLDATVSGEGVSYLPLKS